jgi:hypothetical protein
LARAERISSITLLPRDYRRLPSHFTVQSSSDGADWVTRAEWNNANVFFWSVRHPFLKVVKPRCEIALSRGEPARFLRVVFAPQERRWILSELFLYREDPRADPAADDEIDRIVNELSPLRTTHRMVGDHYFMSLLAMQRFDVEFLPNQYVDNYGRVNPALSSPVPVDFSRRLCLIVPKSHSASVARRLRGSGIPFEARQFAVDAGASPRLVRRRLAPDDHGSSAVAGCPADSTGSSPG